MKQEHPQPMAGDQALGLGGGMKTDKLKPAEASSIRIAGINIKWYPQQGTCTFDKLPVAMMWVDTTLAGVMSGVQAMVGTERFVLALQSEGRKSVEADWHVISKFPDFHDGFEAIANIAAVAGWGHWSLTSLDENQKECRFRVTDNWEARYQRALGVCWGSGMLAGKLAGYCSKLFGTNCWADQTAFAARGDAYDEFLVRPSPRSVEKEIDDLLTTDEATRADIAVALRKLEAEIAERRRMEEELKQSHSLLSATLESTADGILVVDTSGKVASFNQKFLELWRIPQTLAATRDDRQLLQFVLDQLEEPAAFLAKVDELYHTPQASSWDELRFRDRRVFERYSQPQCLGSTIVGRVWSFRDITERKRAEEARQKLQEQLAQSQKMESVGRLAGGVAHDFNNMLGVILGHAELALGEVDPAHPLHSELQGIRSAALRSADLTRQLLAFARKQTIAPRVLLLNNTVAEMLKMLRRLIGEDIDLTWMPGEDRVLWPVKIDPSQIDQILTNLCINARDAIAGVGRITIETENVTFDEACCADHAGCAPGDYVMLAVNDSGCGMDKETLRHLFEPFFTTKNSQGTGLGLATVYGIVRQNHGFIDVLSEPGQGSTFRVYLPRHRETSSPAQAESKAAPAQTKEDGETVLLVEDEEQLLGLARRMLELLGYAVLAARTPTEAIRLAERHVGQIHLLITDVILPEMSGRDLANRVLSVRPNIKLLFTSGYETGVISHQGVLGERIDFLQKPFSIEELAAKARQALEKK